MTRALPPLLLLSLAACRSPQPTPTRDAAAPLTAPQPTRAFTRSAIPRLDTHVHVTLGAGMRAVRFFEQFNIVHAINLSGPPPSHGLADFVADAEVAYGRLTVFANLNWSYARQPGFGERMAADLERAKELGARGVKIPKGLGLGFVGPDRKLLKIDDPSLDPIFEKAGALGLPIAIHSGDPKAFWQPGGADNERHEELEAHPEWGFYEDHKRGELPSWQELFDAFVRRVARHPNTKFIGVHFGNDPEDPDAIAQVLDKNPNLSIDIAARVPAIGRRDAAHERGKMRAFFLKYQDRILFGTDVGVGVRNGELMFGSTGKDPATLEDGRRFYDSIYRYLESDEEGIPSPTPVQGRWTIDGINLPREVLEKIYYKNAVKLIGVKMPTTLLPKQNLETPGPPALPM